MSRILRKYLILPLLMACLSVFGSFQPVVADEVDDWFIAIQNDYTGKVEDMLKAGFDPNTVETKRGDTGLILAMREDSNRVFDLLLADKRTKLDISAFNGDNALMIACYKGNEQAVLKLLKKVRRSIRTAGPRCTMLPPTATTTSSRCCWLVMHSSMPHHRMAPRL